MNTALNFMDIRTLSLASGIVEIILFLGMYYSIKTQKVYKGFKAWTYAALINAAGFILLTFRGIIPDFLTIILANSFLIMFYILILRGLSDFTGGKHNNHQEVILLIIFLLSFTYFTYYAPVVNARIFVFSVIASYYSFKSAFIIYKFIPLIINRKNSLLLYNFMFLGFWFFLRSILSFYTDYNVIDFMMSSSFQGLSIILVFVCHITIVIGLLLINAQRLEFNLINANEKIKSLYGLLPICSSCKSIRDDSGYWRELEEYMSSHSEVGFTHGICPKCMEKLYPEFNTKDIN